MLRPRDLLHRFRPSGTPGAAGGTGVPVEGGLDPAAELAALFAELEATERECHTLRADGEARAARIRASAEEQARDLVDRARALQDAERAGVVARLRSRSEQAAASTAHEAEDRARAVLEEAERNRERDVGLVVDRVRGLLGETPETGTP